MPFAALLPGIIQGAGALLGGLAGRRQRKEGKQLLANTVYPTMPVPGELARQAGEGLPAQQYAQAMRNIQRQQTNAILGAQDRRSALGILGRLQQGTNDATLNLDVADATAKMQNERRYADAKMNAWDWNVRNKYDQDRRYAMSLIGAGNQNIMGGIDKGISALGMLAPHLGGAVGGLFGKRNKGITAANNAGVNQPYGYGTLPTQPIIY